MRSNASGEQARRARASGRRGHGWGGPVPMPYRRAGERPRAAAGSRPRLQRHHLRRRASARRALHPDLRRDRDPSHRGALLQRVRRATPTPRSSSAFLPCAGRPDPPSRRACSTAAPSSTWPAPGRARPCIRRSQHACARSPSGCRSRSPPAPSARRSRPSSPAAACFSLMAIVVTADDVARGKPDPEGYLIALDRLGIPRCRRAVVRGHPLWRHGGGRRRDAVRRRRRHGVGRPASRRRG